MSYIQNGLVFNQDFPLEIGNARDIVVLLVTAKPDGVVIAIFDVDGFQSAFLWIINRYLHMALSYLLFSFRLCLRRKLSQLQ